MEARYLGAQVAEAALIRLTDGSRSRTCGIQFVRFRYPGAPGAAYRVGVRVQVTRAVYCQVLCH